MPVGLTATALTSVAGGVGLTTFLADAVGPALASILVGAGSGAASSAIFGKDPLTGAATGGISGLANFGAPLLGDALGLGSTGLEGILPYALTNAAGGAAGAAISGGDIGKGALFGAGTGALQGGVNQLLHLNPSGSSPAAAGGAAGASPAAATAANTGGLPDLTAPGATLGGTGAGAITVSDLGVPAGAPGSGAGGLGGGAAGAGLGGNAAGGIDTINVTGTRPSFDGLNLGGLTTTGDLGTKKGTGAGEITATDLPGVNGLEAPLSKPLGGTDTGALNGGAANPAANPGNTSSVGKFFDDPSLKNAASVLTSNPGTVLGALGLGYQALTQPHTADRTQLTGNIGRTADELAAQGSAFRNYINNGQLPPGAMAAVNGASTAAKATLKSRYAQLGLSGSTSEATALAQVDQQASAQVFEIAHTLLQDGIKESGMSADLYKLLLADTTAQDKEMSDSIANFAAAIAGGGNRGLNIQVGGQKAA